MSGVERFELARIAPQPWKNGAGMTREIALAGPADAFDWRISIAEVDRDAPFSAFPGIDRCITLLHGAGMRLRSNDGTLDHALTTPLAPFRFSGDVALSATLAGGACSDFNVMTRRGRWRAEVTVLRDATTLPDADAMLLLGCDGDWQIGAEPLGASHALLWRSAPGPIAIRPRGADAALLHVRLCHDRP